MVIQDLLWFYVYYAQIKIVKALCLRKWIYEHLRVFAMYILKILKILPYFNVCIVVKAGFYRNIVG